MIFLIHLGLLFLLLLDVKVYLNQFLSDPRVIEIPKFLWQIILKGIILQVRPRKSASNYKKIWTDNGSPLLDISNKQLSGIKKILSSKYPNIEFSFTILLSGILLAILMAFISGIFPAYSAMKLKVVDALRMN